MTVNVPFDDDMIQFFVSPWWIKKDDPNDPVRQGDLVYAFVPHVDQVPATLRLTGRNTPTDHSMGLYEIKPLDISHRAKPTALPVAAMPLYQDEVHCIYRAKRRPALVISTSGPVIDHKINLGKPKRITAPHLLIAPYYGNQQTGKRGGCLSPELRQRVIQCEYSQFMIDRLPLGASSDESLLRFDHVQPLGHHHVSLQQTGFCLSQESIVVLNEWVKWHICKELDDNGLLTFFRQERPQIV